METVKRRILALLDTPTCATGFAQVSRNVLKHLYSTGLYDIDIIGINHNGDPYDPMKYPYLIAPANMGGPGDFMGLKRFNNVVNGVDSIFKPPYDILFTINDPFVLEQLSPFIKKVQKAYKETLPNTAWFKWIAYWPVDSKLKENWVDTMLLPDYPVAYTQYGLDQMNYWPNKDTAGVDIIPHGFEPKNFFPINKSQRNKFRQAYFSGKVGETDFLITNVSRNQPRKDIMRTLQIFAEFRKKVPDSKLYLHMQNSDAGGTIKEMALEVGLKDDEYILPESFEAGSGVSLETLNKIYNCSDVTLTTTLGEGWGFILTESMACKVPCLAPAHTSITEIFGGNNEDFDEDCAKLRGIPMRCGTTSSEWVTQGLSDYGRLRPLTNVKDGVDKLMWVYKNPHKVKTIVENGHKWVQELTWDKVCKKWIDLFEKAYQDLEEERKATQDIVKEAVWKSMN